MKKSNKNIAIPLNAGMFDWNNSQALLLEHWHNAIDSTLDSLNQVVDFSSETMQRISRQQADTINSYLHPIEKNKDRSKPMKKKISNKTQVTGVALITGGIGGIGTDICKKLAEDGNRIIATYIEAESDYAGEWKSARNKEGIDVDLYECDVTDFETCKKTARAIEKKYARVDIIVNCAGITRDSVLKKMGEEKWHAVLDTNLDSVFNITRNFINGMVKRGYGRIINISSVNGQKGQFGQTNYSSAKAGMIGFTRSLALELAKDGITVNCVCPGYVGTSMVEAIREDIKQGIIDQIPVGRLAKPEEIANAVAFLASKESGYITGTEIAVNGGLWLG